MRRAVLTTMATVGSAFTSPGEPTTPAVAPVSSSGSGPTARQPTTEIRASAVSSPRHVQATSKLALRQLDAGSRVLKTTCFWVPFARKVHPAVLFSEARYHCVHKICQFFFGAPRHDGKLPWQWTSAGGGGNKPWNSKIMTSRPSKRLKPYGARLGRSF